MMIFIEFNNEEAELVKTYAKANNISISDLIRDAVFEKIEDEHDLKCYDEAMEEYKVNPVTYSLDEIKKEIGI